MAFLMPLLVFTACDRFPDELIVTINESGYIIVKAVDNDGKALEGATVVISGNSSFRGITDASGMYAPERMLQGSYNCEVSFTIGELEYRERRTIQVIAGETRTLEFNPFANSGNLDIQLVGFNEQILPVGLNVLLLPQNFYNADIDVCIAAANFKGKVDSQNKISFAKVPASLYRVWIYDDTKKIHSTVDDDSYIQIERGKTTNRTIRVAIW